MGCAMTHARPWAGVRGQKGKGKMERGTVSEEEFEAAAYSENGEPSAGGPRCATCDDLAAWGTHPMCERDEDGKLVMWVPDPDERQRAR